MGAFLVEFALLDSRWLTAILQSLCTDDTLVGHLAEIVDFRYRLKLVEWVAERHELPTPLAADLKSALNKAEKLAVGRNQVAHNPPMIQLAPATPGSAQVFRGGVRKKRSKRKLPAKFTSLAEVSKAYQDWIVPVETVKEWFRETELLNLKMMQLSVRIQTYIETKIDPG
jgi:hypothetical protein